MIIEDSIELMNVNTELTQYDKEIKKSLEVSGNKIAESINTIHSDLKETINKVIQDNTDPKKLLDEILKVTQDKFSNVYSLSRAETIAITTNSNAVNVAKDESYKRHGFKKMWVSQRTGNRRQNHIAYDGTLADEKGLFYVGGDTMPYPTGGSIAKENVRCHCFTIPRK